MKKRDLSLLAVPHPKRRASLSAYWSGSALVGGKQIKKSKVLNRSAQKQIVF